MIDPIEFRKSKLNFYKLQGGFYELRNRDVVFVVGFGNHSGWGVNLTHLDAQIYVWTTDDGCCEYKDNEEPRVTDYDIVKYLGKTLPKDDVINKKPMSSGQKALELAEKAIRHLKVIEKEHPEYFKKHKISYLENSYKFLEKEIL